MATETGSGSNTWLAFLVGGLLVGLLVLGYFVYSGNAPAPDNTREFNLKIETPNLPPTPMPEPMPKG
jgi:hypothetical protein